MSSTYNTKQKQFILKLLSDNSEKQYTCDDIEDALRNKGTPVGKSTVYRYLTKLQSEGKVRKFNEDGKVSFYRFVENEDECNHHIHLKCVSCGDFIHLSCDFMNEINSHLIKDHKFSLDNSKTVLYGTCEKCGLCKE